MHLYQHIGIDMGRVKAGIIEEFEKSRADYNDALERARLTSKSKLQKRKHANGRSNGSVEGGGTDGGTDGSVEVFGVEGVSKTQAAFEEILDVFLEEPTPGRR
jgi:hypothetical protein